MTNPQNFNQQEPPFDPDYDQVPPAEQAAEQPAVDGQQAAAGQPEPQSPAQQNPAQPQQPGQQGQNAPAGNAQTGNAQTGNEQEMLGATGDAQDGNLEKDPSEWVSGNQPATEAQKSYIDTLAKQAGEQIPANLTKAEASQHIDRLKKITGQ